MRTLQYFVDDTSGAITVEFVILGAAITAVTIAVLVFLADGLGERADVDSELIATTEDRNQTAIDLMHEGVNRETATGLTGTIGD